MELSEAVAELYAMEPEGFLVRRKELVAEARAAKDRDAVKAIGALRRPAVAAWLVNLLTRDVDGGRRLITLAALGEDLRAAQFELQADRLRELGRQRRTQVADLVSLAVDLAEAAGHTVSPAVEREIDETLVAAVADGAAAEAVLSGSLTRPLSYSGFGEVDVDLAVALLPTARAVPAPAAPDKAPARPPHHEPDPAPVDAGPSPAQLRQAAEREVRLRELEASLTTAESALVAAADDATRATARLVQARTAAAEAAEAVTRLQEQLDTARDTVRAATAQQQAAEADVGDCERRERAAKDEVERLRRDLVE